VQGRLRLFHTSFFVGLTNTASPSCVRTIEDVLSTLTPSPYSIDVSVVLQSVRVRHNAELNRGTIELAIKDAGFDIENSTPQDASVTIKQEALSQNLPSTFPAKQRKHIAQCSFCQSGEARTYVITELPNSEGVPEASKAPAEGQGPVTLSLSVGGMTCAACSNTLTRLLSEVDGVTDVVVDLMGHSARVVVESQKLTPVVVETVEDAGFDADVVKVEPLVQAPIRETTTRTISLKVDCQ
jgi:P-type Cu+ transporter